jgi:hypothetical protein
MRCALYWPIFADYRMFPAAMPKFKGDQKISRNSANFEQIFDIFLPYRSE